MTLRLQPVQVGTGSSDMESQLVYSEGLLVAVLVRLSDDHDDRSGMWFLEAGFGRVDHPDPPTFADLDAAQDWIAQRLAGTS
ncbi:hypothetical protein ACSD7O_06830 [Methylorubrum extorquens]|jgi:hypothetical protein|uniref:Uncharacterized protein n=1 Tax=Methylorubrum extorquens TaxID=408 RepID=A0A1S1P2J8_METEX|nr:hypothetical protein [Methylorubrum extorquens]MDF9861341.1 hypothetical protein [Methylorubrum pseudosasae]MDH6634970.1 hypothetical protein [Methylobacterium sp. SuP10 SLI 274]MDH6664139.1 hypothetical protein [Methylorubrum zatmanii]MCP1535495.1 hypothetical protein [Methylorubrum extorquens]MCP1561145.1 hypothetical protein [Methylorubrum extorquens]